MVESIEVYEPVADEKVSETVIRALADSRGTDPAGMDLRLYDLVDPDALDALFPPSADTTGQVVAFSTAESRVVIDESRRVHVTNRNAEPKQSGSVATAP